MKTLSILLLLSFGTLMLWSFSLAMVTVKVVDESGNAVQDATVSIVFKYGHLKKDAVVKRSDKKGRCRFIERTPDGTLAGSVTKAGFYKTGISDAFVSRKLGMWRPWNKEIVAVLRPILHPVPMYVRSRDFEIPAIGKKAGLDLMIGDWVPPYGKGVKGDLIFEHRRRYKDNWDFDSVLTISFPNRHDGIQAVNEDTIAPFTTRSSYLLPRFAPESGYEAVLVKRVSEGPRARSSRSYDRSYIFRVRSESNLDGSIKRAMYGKIRGEITFFPVYGANGTVRLHYFLNPDYSRNLEFDPKHNLSTDISENERVGDP